jgi:hypothetical protein
MKILEIKVLRGLQLLECKKNQTDSDETGSGRNGTKAYQ